jgi:hypothetical protein
MRFGDTIGRESAGWPRRFERVTITEKQSRSRALIPSRHDRTAAEIGAIGSISADPFLQLWRPTCKWGTVAS